MKQQLSLHRIPALSVWNWIFSVDISATVVIPPPPPKKTLCCTHHWVLWRSRWWPSPRSRWAEYSKARSTDTPSCRCSSDSTRLEACMSWGSGRPSGDPVCRHLHEPIQLNRSCDWANDQHNQMVLASFTGCWAAGKECRLWKIIPSPILSESVMLSTYRMT